MTGVLLGLGLAVGVGLYAYAGYPLLLVVLGATRKRPAVIEPKEWPAISVTVPAYNEEGAIGATLDAILACDYPADRLQILVVSDASTDRTDEIVRSYQGRGVELLRQPERGGKTAAENAARDLLRGEIIINTDASVRLAKNCLKPLVAHFSDPTVGVASGRDVSVARAEDTANVGESGYVGYEMWVRDRETLLAGIVGASGCFYGIRAQLHMSLVPAALSRDFASALIAREAGYRAVSVNEAVCFVPRTSRLRAEYRRKVRTMARGMETLFFKRHLLNPFEYPLFAWMLFSHKVCRWAAPWAFTIGVLLALVLGWQYPLVKLAALGVALAGVLALVGWNWPEERPLPRLIAIPTFAITGNIAALHAGIKAMRGERNPIWEPTRRRSVPGA